MTDTFVLTPFFLERQRLRLLRVARPGWHVNQPVVKGTAQRRRMAAIHTALAAFVTGAVQQGERPVSIAGDCCAAIPVLAGLRRAGVAPVLVWLDAHGDFNTPDTSPSGFIGGMPLAMIAGRGELDLVRAVGLAPQPEADIVLCDGRDLDPLERAALEASSVRRVTDVARLVESVPADRPIYVHFDSDFIDAEDSPAHLYPVRGGPRLEQARAVLARLARERNVVAVSVAAWDLAHDRGRVTEQATLAVLEALLTAA